MIPEISIQQVVSRYVRAVDSRDGDAIKVLFIENGIVEIFTGPYIAKTEIAVLKGAGAIADSVANRLKPHAPGEWSHHTTLNPIIEINGNEATVDSQFIVYAISAYGENVTTSPSGVKGKVAPVESGYYMDIPDQ